MIYVTGDVHGDINRFSEEHIPGESSMTNEDYLIICGDFGFIFTNSAEEKGYLDILEKKPYNILWVDGNHENFDAISQYPIEIWNGGKIHRIRKNIIHLMRGQVFEIENKRFFTMGGAYSVDKYMRKKGYSWWEKELPCDKEYKEATENLRKNKELDYIITHTAPREIIYRLNFYPDPHDLELTGFLEWVMHEFKFKHWFFGHFHEDEEINDKLTAIYNKVIRLD